MTDIPSSPVGFVPTAAVIAPPTRPSKRPAGAARWVRARAVLTRSVLAMGSGVLLWASFPPRTMWWLAPLGIAALTAVVRGRRPRGGFFYGYLAGLAFFGPLLPWVGVYVGAVPWLALTAVEAVFVGLFGAVAAAVTTLRCAPLWVAAAWVATEAARSRVPFGGFPWGRLAFGQAEGPFLPLAAVGGAPAVSFAVALTGTGLAATGVLLWGRRRRVAALAAAVAAAPILVTATAAGPGPAGQPTTAAVVQGNVPRLGLDFNAQRRAVLDNHLARTEQLAADVAAGRVPRPRLVIWPENASDIDPLRNRDAAARLDRAARAMGVPVLAGTVLREQDGTTRNSVMVWDPVTGPGQQHLKRQLVPFGEYLPLPGLMRALSPYAASAGNFVAGDGNGVVDLNGVPVAVATCYEVAFDSLVTASVRAGAQVITVPTNNATFGRTDMTYQQLAMSRVRAVEHGRAVLIAATSGVSAVITPDGQVQQQSAIFTADALVARIDLRSDLTAATRLGVIPELVLAAAALTGFAYAMWRGRRSRRPEPPRLNYYDA